MLAALQDMTEAHCAELAELRALGMRVARVVTEAAEAADSFEDKKAAPGWLAVAARTVRQCQALEARTRRALLKDQIEAARRDRETAEETLACDRAKAEAEDLAYKARIERRRAPIHQRVLRVLEELHPDQDDDEEQERFDTRCEDLRTRLCDETFDLEFAFLPYEEVISRVHEALGLPPPVFTAQDAVWAGVWNAHWDGPDPVPIHTPASRRYSSA